MKSRFLLRLVNATSRRTAFATILAVATLHAGPITLTLAGTATGTLGSTSFTNAAFSVTSQADTEDVTVNGSIYEVAAIGSSIAIGGILAAQFTDEMLWLDPQGSGDMIFRDSAIAVTFPPTADLLFINPISDLTTYQFQTSIGPVSVSNAIPDALGAFSNIPTDQGSLTIASVSNAAFDAIVPVSSSPEPATFWLAGVAGISFILRRRAAAENTSHDVTSSDAIGQDAVLAERRPRPLVQTPVPETVTRLFSGYSAANARCAGRRRAKTLYGDRSCEFSRT
jgi:hypothetical protein